jgi:hypothetical protein
MKSFRQYISEVVTEKPKGIEFEHEKLPLGIGTGNHVHNYHIKHPNGRNYKTTMHTRTEDGYKMSTINFADTHGYTTRTGAQGVKRATRVLSQVHHVIKHHIKNEKPDKIIFVSDPDEAGGQNRGARHGIYHKMGKRSADKLGYRHAPELTGKGGVVQHYVKKKKKK